MQWETVGKFSSTIARRDWLVGIADIQALIDLAVLPRSETLSTCRLPVRDGTAAQLSPLRAASSRAAVKGAGGVPDLLG